MTKIFIDAGHGGTDSGATGNGLWEKDLTLSIALKTRDILNAEYEGHSIMLSRSTDESLSLTERTNMANNWSANYLVSIHINAGGGTGFESYTHNGNYAGKAETNRLRSMIHNKIVQESGFRDRGKKEANFHMLRESNMSASLTENGFIDHSGDTSKLKSDVFLEQLARGHAVGLAKALGLNKKSKNTFYRVITGSFKKRSNADNQVDELAAHNFDSFIVASELEGATHYRVITGSYQQKENADNRVRKLKEVNFDSFIKRFEK